MGQRIILVAAGAGAGIAATFNTPIGGVLFATELMLPEISVNTFLPVAIATGTATFIGRLFFGAQPAFSVPSDLAPLPARTEQCFLSCCCMSDLEPWSAWPQPCSFAACIWAEDGFDKIPGRYLRHMPGDVAGRRADLRADALGRALLRRRGWLRDDPGDPHGQLAAGGFLLLLYRRASYGHVGEPGLRLVGWHFSPSLFMGATLGGAFAALASPILPGLPISIPAFAMVGMGTMVGSATGAALTAVAMIFEMTRDYDIVLPMILAVAVGLGVRRMLSRENIYTMKLVRRGHPIPKALHANMFLVRSASDAMDRDFLLVDEATSFDDFMRMAPELSGMRHVVVTRGNLIVGVLRVNTALRRTVSAGRATLRSAPWHSGTIRSCAQRPRCST